MAADPEALAQLARLLGDDRLRRASTEDVHASIDASFDRLVGGLFDEVMASDDVTDRDAAIAFVDDRLRFFGPLISESQRSRLWDAIREKIEAW